MTTSNRIADSFAHAQHPLIIPYVTIGDGGLDTTRQTITTLSKAGAGIIELGLPFSEPMADGPVIQHSMQRALQNPFSLTDVFAMTDQVRTADNITTPLVMMSYANPVYQYGLDRFCRDAVANGVDGAIITDMPPEMADDYLASARQHNLQTVFLCSPTTSPERMPVIHAASSGFVYYVARKGVTGTQSNLDSNLCGQLRTARSHLAETPLCVGFGISKPEHIHTLAPHADGLVVGSLLVDLFSRYRETALQTMLHDTTASLVEAANACLKTRKNIHVPG